MSRKINLKISKCYYLAKKVLVLDRECFPTKNNKKIFQSGVRFLIKTPKMVQKSKIVEKNSQDEIRLKIYFHLYIIILEQNMIFLLK